MVQMEVTGAIRADAWQSQGDGIQTIGSHRFPVQLGLELIWLFCRSHPFSARVPCRILVCRVCLGTAIHRPECPWGQRELLFKFFRSFSNQDCIGFSLPLHFHMNFWISLSVLAKKEAGILIRIALNL